MMFIECPNPCQYSTTLDIRYIQEEHPLLVVIVHLCTCLNRFDFIYSHKTYKLLVFQCCFSILFTYHLILIQYQSLDPFFVTNSNLKLFSSVFPSFCDQSSCLQSISDFQHNYLSLQYCKQK